jgi:hypothetical protein
VLVLLAACANVGSLLLARAGAKELRPNRHWLDRAVCSAS